MTCIALLAGACAGGNEPAATPKAAAPSQPATPTRGASPTAPAPVGSPASVAPSPGPASPGPATPAPARSPAASSPTAAASPRPGAIVLEAERGRGIEPLQDYETWEGWTSYWGQNYSSIQAAITRQVDQSFSLVLDPSVRPGSYDVALTVLDYGDGGANEVEVSLGSASQRARWKSATLGPATVRVGPFVVNPATEAGRTITITTKAVGQPAVIIDTVAVEPR